MKAQTQHARHPTAQAPAFGGRHPHCHGTRLRRSTGPAYQWGLQVWLDWPHPSTLIFQDTEKSQLATKLRSATIWNQCFVLLLPPLAHALGCGTMRAACFSSLAPQMGQTPHASQVIATQKSLRRSTLGLKQAPDSSRPNLACIIHLHRSGRLPAAAADLVHYDVLVPLQHTTSTARFENGKRNT